MTASSNVTNPIIPGFHPDPSICRVGSEYFLATSTFTWFPGVPVFRSENLTEWVQLGNALDRPSQLDLSDTDAWSSFGVYAPTLRHHDGKFWLITTILSMEGSRNFFLTTDDPGGAWSEPTPITITGIDPDLAWDDEGNCWVHYSRSGEIMRCRIDDLTGDILEGPTPTWSGTGLQHPEGPHLYRIGSFWYLLIAEGGTGAGHAVSVARSQDPRGPWEPCPANPILSHRSTGQPIQNTGHGDLVEAPDGTWWLVLLGVRPRGAIAGFHVLGRETFLTSVTWSAGWPTVASPELESATVPLEPCDPTAWNFHDDFDRETLDPSWIAPRRPPSQVADLQARAGSVTISDEGTTLDDARPALIGRRQQHHRCVATTVVDLHTGEAGLAVVMDEYSHYRVSVDETAVSASARIGPFRQTFGRETRSVGPVELFVETVDGLVGPDRVRLGFRGANGERVVLAELDGRYLSTQVATGFTGRIIGIYASHGSASFDWFDYRQG